MPPASRCAWALALAGVAACAEAGSGAGEGGEGGDGARGGPGGAESTSSGVVAQGGSTGQAELPVGLTVGLPLPGSPATWSLTSTSTVPTVNVVVTVTPAGPATQGAEPALLVAATGTLGPSAPGADGPSSGIVGTSDGAPLFQGVAVPNANGSITLLEANRPGAVWSVVPAPPGVRVAAVPVTVERVTGATGEPTESGPSPAPSRPAPSGFPGSSPWSPGWGPVPSRIDDGTGTVFCLMGGLSDLSCFALLDPSSGTGQGPFARDLAAEPGPLSELFDSAIPTSVPEPTTAVLVVGGLLALASVLRRRAGVTRGGAGEGQ